MSVWPASKRSSTRLQERHRLVSARRREWFERPEGAYQVLWWVPEGHRPTLEEGLARLAKLNVGPDGGSLHFKARFPFTDKGRRPEDMQPEPYCVGWE